MKAVKQLVLIAFLAASIVAAKLSIYYIPNVEFVTLLFITYACLLPLRLSLATAIVFVGLEFVLWGAGEWLIGYYIAWPLLVIMTYYLKNFFKDNHDFWALFAGTFGILFGMIFALVHALFYGISFGFAYWTRGLTFDLIHCFANYIIVLLLYTPLINTLKKLLVRWEGNHDSHYETR